MPPAYQLGPKTYRPEGLVTTYLLDAPLAHAITDIDGYFVNVDDRFCELLRRPRDDIVGATILNLTGEPFRSLNAGKLDELRGSRTPFTIRKTYLCGDGSQQAVENAVSIVEGARAPLVAASVRALPTGPGERLAACVAVAGALLAEQRDRAALDTVLGADWRLILAAFIAEARGDAGWAGDIAEVAGGDVSGNLLRLWELVAGGILVMDGSPASIERASVRVAHRYAQLVEQHLSTLVPGLNSD